jgi:hypothetical protein
VEGTGAGSSSGEAEMQHVVIMAGEGSAKMAVLTLQASLVLAKK